MEKQTSLKPKLIIVAQFGKTRGIDGKISVRSFFANPFDILKYRNFFFEDLEKTSIKFHKLNNKIFAKIEKINSPETAQKLVGKFLYIEKTQLPKLKKNEFYYEDLEMLDVFVKNKKIGKVICLNNHGAGDYLEISTKKEEILVPYNFDHIVKIDMKEKKIFLNPDYYDF